jgi:V8-like Glu-specific endopeptidase
VPRQRSQLLGAHAPGGRRWTARGWSRSLLSRRVLKWLALPAVAAIGLIVTLAVGLLPPTTASLVPQAVPFSGTATVGAFFTVKHGQPDVHFCSGSVIDSPNGNLVLTAAHCVNGRSPGSIDFVPDYRQGSMPYGVWQVRSIFVDASWTMSQSPDDDFALVQVSQAGSHHSIESATGGERLGGALNPERPLQVIGYPDTTNTPVTCENQGILFTATQIQFDCGGYTIGTSGGPMLVRLPGVSSPLVIGVIGGYEQGGVTAAVSYAARFRSNFVALYQLASAPG